MSSRAAEHKLLSATLRNRESSLSDAIPMALTTTINNSSPVVSVNRPELYSLGAKDTRDRSRFG